MQLVTVGSDSWRAWPNIYMYLLHVLPAFPVPCGFAMVRVLRGRNQTSEYTWLEKLCRCAVFRVVRSQDGPGSASVLFLLYRVVQCSPRSSDLYRTFSPAQSYYLQDR